MTDKTQAPPPTEHDGTRIIVGKTLEGEVVYARWTPIKGSIGKPNYTKKTGETLRFADIDKNTIPTIILKKKLMSGSIGRSEALCDPECAEKAGNESNGQVSQDVYNLDKEPSVADMLNIQLATASAHPRLEIPTVEWIENVRKTAKDNEKPEDTLTYTIWRAETTKEDGLAAILQDTIDTVAEEAGTDTHPNGRSSVDKIKFWDETRATLAMILKKWRYSGKCDLDGKPRGDYAYSYLF
ncbi:hypothetical protein BKA63DRAFT_550398 [Paraphoma chrysanthemicola]|nr:hypothetical protein BKA63DRAFT_550398 [Paraphoma chrysanthemicola]